MKLKLAMRLTMMMAAGLMAAPAMVGQVPAGSTGQCKDGTYTTSASQPGACRGHQGVKTWFAASAAGPATTPSVAAKATTAASAAPAKAMTVPTAAKTAATPAVAVGGEPGMVWVNTATKVYHCPGTKYYGKTKAGSYMTEAAAKAKGAHADHNQPCKK